MLRRIPTETATFHFHNENPRDIRTGDCVIRAIGRATGKGWDDTLDGLYQIAKRVKSGLNCKECYETYLAEQGWIKAKQPRKPDGSKYTVAEWCSKQPHTTMLVTVSNHMTCIIKGKCNDIWNCTWKTVLNYWVNP